MALTQVSTGGIKDGQVHTADLADAQITAGKLHADALDRTYTLGASGNNHYTFTGEGLTGAVNDPTLYLTRGKTYRFVNGNSSGAHPFRIQSVAGAGGTEYNTGVTNNAGAGGSTIIFEVPHDAPDVLYYICTSHPAMNGVFYITGALADGGVTTAKLANSAVTDAKIADGGVTTAKIATDAVTQAKIAASAIHTENINDNAVTTAKITDANITTAKIQDDAVTGDKVADGTIQQQHLASSAVTTAKIAAGAVSAAKIADATIGLDKLHHGTSSNDGKFLRANNGADPTFEAVSSDFVKISSTTMSGEASEFDILFDNSTYQQFRIYITGLNLSFDSSLYVRFRVGTSFVTAGNYYGGTIKKYSGGFDSSTYGGQHQSYGYLSDNVGGNDATYERWSGIVDILCGNNGGMPFLRHDSFYKDSAATHVNTMGIVGYQNWSVLSGVRFYAGSGNINHGKFDVYGIK